ncbi:MAG: carbohydrate ABC transporter substrate-binding protein [Phycisphaeraceae bacterium]|nr:carbohydrate ABC transporter substrate-binding protein [Phycisphaeraceae bacterium]
MKYLFLTGLVLLSLASAALYTTQPRQVYPYPVVYWVTDKNPERPRQIALFHDWEKQTGWLRRRHAENPEEYPLSVILVDAASRDPQKQLVQGVSGVSGDVMDVFSTLGDHVFYHTVGMLTDLTRYGPDGVDVARQRGFSLEQTYPTLGQEIAVQVWTEDGVEWRQVMFPANVTVNSLQWVNRETFRKFDLPLPPNVREGFTFEQFEELGRRFVVKANEGLSERQFFFTNSVSFPALYRSLGLDLFNETMTAAHVADFSDPRNPVAEPRFVRALETKHRWMHELNLIPTSAEARSFTAASVKFGPQLDLFRRGNYAMIEGGLYFIIQFRDFQELGQGIELAVTSSPHGGFPVESIATRAAAIYKGTPNPKEALAFVEFMASEEYNRDIVRAADALPPNPRYTRTSEFRTPEGRRGLEWDELEDGTVWSVSEDHAWVAENQSIGTSFSLFIHGREVNRLHSGAESRYMANALPRMTAESIAIDLAREINASIQRTLDDQPALRELHAQLTQTQRRIEELRARGEKVPLEWIANPFYRRYYVAMGWSDPE